MPKPAKKTKTEIVPVYGCLPCGMFIAGKEYKDTPCPDCGKLRAQIPLNDLAELVEHYLTRDPAQAN